MTPESEDKLKAFFATFSRGHSPLLLLDYDGTLAPFRLDRFQARPWAGVCELLAEMQRRARTRITVVSGRPAREVAQLLGLVPAPEIWGLHGAERLHPGGRCELDRLPAETAGRLDGLREQLRRDSFGGLLEEKYNAVVMHWRGASPRKAAEIEERTRALFEPLANVDGLMLLKFEAGLELRAGRDKGAAAKAILDEAGGGEPLRAPIAFLGDDLTDESAFRIVNEQHCPHLTALVRREMRETAADVWLRPPRELVEFMRRWLKTATTS